MILNDKKLHLRINFGISCFLAYNNIFKQIISLLPETVIFTYLDFNKYYNARKSFGETFYLQYMELMRFIFSHPQIIVSAEGGDSKFCKIKTLQFDALQNPFLLDLKWERDLEFINKCRNLSGHTPEYTRITILQLAQK